MEQEPDTENVVYLDEYPELKKRVWLRRLHAQRQMGVVAIYHEADVVQLEPPDEPA